MFSSFLTCNLGMKKSHLSFVTNLLQAGLNNKEELVLLNLNYLNLSDQ